MKNRYSQILQTTMFVFIMFMYIATSELDIAYTIGDILDAIGVYEGSDVISVLLVASFAIACTTQMLYEVFMIYVNRIKRYVKNTKAKTIAKKAAVK